MSRSLFLGLARLVCLAVAVSLAPSSVALAQRALPVDALAFDGLVVRSVRAPDREGLPVRVVLGSEQEPRFVIDVWVTASSGEAEALLAARLGSLSTLGLTARADVAQAHAFATAASGPAGLVALTVENVAVVVRAVDGDATSVAAHVALAIRASAPPTAVAVPAPGPLADEMRVQAPAGALDWLVTCEGVCAARRLDHAFRVTRTDAGGVDVALHVVDAFLRAQHVHAPL